MTIFSNYSTLHMKIMNHYVCLYLEKAISIHGDNNLSSQTNPLEDNKNEKRNSYKQRLL